MTERWLPVVGYEGYYEVSDEGQVRSIRTNFGNPRERLLKPQPTHDGYQRVELSKDNEQERRHVSHLVLEAFVGPRPAGLQACHGDDDGSNNRLSNLRWDTRRANYDDAIRNGNRKGEKHHGATITEEVARQIKVLAANRSIWAREIADKFNTTVHVVRNIRNGKTWAWV